MNRLILIVIAFVVMIGMIMHRNHAAREESVKVQQAIAQRHAAETNRIAEESAQASRHKQQREARENNEIPNVQVISSHHNEIDKYKHQTSKIDEYNQVLIKLRALLEHWKYASNPRELQAIRHDIDNIDSPACINDAKRTLSTTLGNERIVGNEEETQGAFKAFLREFNLCVREVTDRKT